MALVCITGVKSQAFLINQNDYGAKELREYLKFSNTPWDNIHILHKYIYKNIQNDRS
jgi:hypothetical protein